MEKSFPKLPPLELLPVGVLLKFTEFIRGLHDGLQVSHSLLQLLNFSLQGLVLLLEVPLLPGAGQSDSVFKYCNCNEMGCAGVLVVLCPITLRSNKVYPHPACHRLDMECHYSRHQISSLSS